MIYLFEMAGFSSYIMGCGIGSKKVQECSFMHTILWIRPILNWVAMVCNLKKMGPQNKSFGNTALEYLWYKDWDEFRIINMYNP